MSKFKHSSINFVIVLLVCLLVAVICFFINFLINLDKTATITILVAPSDATVTLNGKEYPTDTSFKVIPGTYPVSISAPNFTTFSGVIEAKDNETTYIYESLKMPDVEANTAFYANHSEEAARAQRIADFVATLEQTAYLGTDPIFNITPYSSYEDGFEIYSSRQPFLTSALEETNPLIDSSKIYIKIYLLTCSETELEDLKSAANQYLTNHSIDLSKYNITYSNC